MADEIERAIVSVKAILESLTPTELILEYTRVFRDSPPEGQASGQLIEPILTRLRHDLELDGKPRST